MEKIRVLIYPYGADEPYEAIIDNSIDIFEVYIEGRITESNINDRYTLIYNSDIFEEYKYQEEYDIFGNFIIVKRDKDENNDYISLDSKDILFIKENAKTLLIYNFA